MASNSVAPALQEALSQHRAGNVAAAEAGYRRVLRDEPQHADAKHLLGVLLYGKGAFAEAHALILDAARTLSRNPDVLSNLAMASLSAGQPEAARDAASRALALAPRHAQALYFLGVASEQMGRIDDAVAHFRAALDVLPALQPARAALYRHVEPTGREIQFLENLAWRETNAADWRDATLQAIGAKRPFLERRGNRAQLDLLDMVAEALGATTSARPPQGRRTVGGASPDPAQGRYLVVRAWGQGFWADVDHVLGQLLVAEILGRMPVVHWGENSRYGGTADHDAFSRFFEPVGPALGSLDLEGASFFPPKWNATNLGGADVALWSGEHSRCSAIRFFDREEAVVVGDFFTQIMQIRRWLPDTHPLARQPLEQAYRYLVGKYLRPRAEWLAAADAFVRSRFAGPDFVALHLRGLDKGQECADLAFGNDRLLDLTASLLERDPALGVFVMTDDTDLQARARARFGARMAETASARARGDAGLHLLADKAAQPQLGAEILVDSLIASRAAQFLGVGASNVATMIGFLRDWPEGSLHLIGRKAYEIPNLMLGDW